MSQFYNVGKMQTIEFNDNNENIVFNYKDNEQSQFLEVQLFDVNYNLLAMLPDIQVTQSDKFIN